MASTSNLINGHLTPLHSMTPEPFIPEINSANYPDQHPIFVAYPSDFLGLNPDAQLPNPQFNHSTPPQPSRPTLEGYVIEGGWQEGSDGEIHHIGHGAIEEVNSEGNPLEPRQDPIMPLDDHGVFVLTDPLPECTTPPPPPRQRYQRLLSPSPWPPFVRRNIQGFTSLGMNTPTTQHTSRSVRGHEPDLHAANARLSDIPTIPTDYKTAQQSMCSDGNSSIGSFPICSTPPPRHRLRPSGLSRSTTPWPQASGSNWLLRHLNTPPPKSSKQTPLPPKPPTPPPKDRPSPPPPKEDLLTTNIRLVEVASASVDAVCSVSAFFMSVGHLHDVVPHRATCTRVKGSLSALMTALQRRHRFGSEQWQMGSQRWHKKYAERLSSLQRTLQKLCGFVDHLGDHHPKLKTINKGLDKLMEYESKLSNLASKFNSLFDRLRVRHLHSTLSKAHAEAQDARKNAHSARDLPRWAEEKAHRADLRREYHAYRTGRRPSLVS